MSSGKRGFLLLGLLLVLLGLSLMGGVSIAVKGVLATPTPIYVLPLTS